MLRNVPPKLGDDFDTLEAILSWKNTPTACSVPATPSPRANGAMAFRYWQQAPPALTEQFQDTPSFDVSQVPSTPSPSNESASAFYTGILMGHSGPAMCSAQQAPSDFIETTHSFACQYNVAQHLRASHDVPVSAIETWAQHQQVPRPPTTPPRFENCAEPYFAELPPVPPTHADTSVAPMVAQDGRKCLKSNHSKDAFITKHLPHKHITAVFGQRQSHRSSPRVTSRVGQAAMLAVKELEVASSQASTADTTETSIDDSVFSLVPQNAMQPDFRGWHSGAANRYPDHGVFWHPHNTLLVQVAHQTDSGAPHLPIDHMSAYATPHKADLASNVSPQLGSMELPSIGSLGHSLRRCKPCAFVTKMGCNSGARCVFCHLCEDGEKKRRRKEKKALMSAARKLGGFARRQGNAEPPLTCV